MRQLWSLERFLANSISFGIDDKEFSTTKEITYISKWCLQSVRLTTGLLLFCKAGHFEDVRTFSAILYGKLHFWLVNFIRMIRGRSRAAAISKMECFVVTVFFFFSGGEGEGLKKIVRWGAPPGGGGGGVEKNCKMGDYTHPTPPPTHTHYGKPWFTTTYHQPKYIHHHPPTAKTFLIRNPFIRISTHCLMVM